MRKFNKQQTNYMKAQAILKSLEEESNMLDRDYIRTNKIVNEDGSNPKVLYTIDNQEAFDKANAECSKRDNDNGLWNKILVARESLKSAEDALFIYGLKIIPTREREILAKEANVNYTVKLKIIELTMKLDCSTVPA